jgi:hypothetical protein
MGDHTTERIEAAADRLAAAVFAVAAAFATWKLGPTDGMWTSALAGCVGGGGYFLLARSLRGLGSGNPTFELPKFVLAEFEPAEPDELLLTEQVELVLTEADRFPPRATDRPNELLLDDILAEIDPDSRVVRLFDPATMPTPAQLNARIERHLNRGTFSAAPPDASQALYDALADLRRSLR